MTSINVEIVRPDPMPTAPEKPVTVPGDVKNLVVDLCCPIVGP